MQITAESPVTMTNDQLEVAAIAAIDLQSDTVVRLLAEWHCELEYVKHKRWFRLLVMQTLAKEYNLAYAGI